ncbi:MAG: NADH-quinone oxidoreductase subunit NuoK [Sulfolobales archaeon]|jgi:NADH:ubiquinone oxidoreductase subunit K
MNYVLLTASILLAISVYGILSSRNIARILISAEIMFNAFILVVVGAFSYIYSYLGGIVLTHYATGYVSTLILVSILLAVSEIVVTFSILIALIRYGVLKKIDTEERIIRDLAIGGEEK